MDVTLAWNANSETNLSGYRLYYGTNSCGGLLGCRYSHMEFVPAPGTNWTVRDIDATPGHTTYFALTALTSDGLESDPSAEIPYTPVPALQWLESSVVETPPPSPAPFIVETESIFQPASAPPSVESHDVVLEASAAGPPIEIVPIGRPVIAFRLRFRASANQNCELQVSGDLRSWSPLIPFFTGAAPEQLEFIDLPTGDSRRYYRLAMWTR